MALLFQKKHRISKAFFYSMRIRAYPFLKSRPLFCGLSMAFFLGASACRQPVPVNHVTQHFLKNGLPATFGLAYGRILVHGWKRTMYRDTVTRVEFRDRATDQAFSYKLDENGEFYWALPAGSYEISTIWSGFERVSQTEKNRGIHFYVPSDTPVYLGDLLIRIPSRTEAGSVDLLDDFDNATLRFRWRHTALSMAKPPEKHLFFPPAPRR